MKAVVNATPLIALALLDQLDLLRVIFDEIIVPTAVYRRRFVVNGMATTVVVKASIASF